jgi:hypothetical protein
MSRKQSNAGVVVSSDLKTRVLRPAYWVLVVWLLLAMIFWGNLFRFSPSLIDGAFDSTSEGVVIGRLAHAAVDGVFKDTDLGTYIDPQQRTLSGKPYYTAQLDYYEDPDLIRSRQLEWGGYPSQFGLQGFVFSMLDLVNPLPRKWHIGFYHLLASLFAAGMLVWIADILRRRFGWPAFAGFLIPVAVEPTFSALAPNLYWVVGSFFAPMAIAMLLADEDEPRRRLRLIAMAFCLFLAKFLCGYEFTSTVILAAAAGCLFGVKEIPDRLRHMLRDGSWIASAGVAAFIVAALMHSAKEGGFAVFATKAANRMTGDGASLQEDLIFGKFVSIGTVVWSYLGGNAFTLIKHFGIMLTALAVYAVMTLLDPKFTWFFGPDRRKLQILSIAFLASIAAPLSWFVLGKGHSFDHLPIDMILWYVPTVPLGFAMIGLALAQLAEHRALWRVDAARNWVTVGIPFVIVCAIVVTYFADRNITTQGTWVIAEHEDALPIFESTEAGLQLRMTDQFFTVQYRCSAFGNDQPFVIHADQGTALVDYSFRPKDKQVISDKVRCISAQEKSDGPISRIRFAATSRQGKVWESDSVISLPDRFTLAPFSDENWDHGIRRSSRTELLVLAGEFNRLMIRKGDHLELSASDRRTITAIRTTGDSKVISVDGPPIEAGGGDSAPIRIIRQ